MSLLSLLLLLPLIPLVSADCTAGVPSSGVIPSTWSVRRFTLLIGATPLLNSRNESITALTVNGTIPGPRLDVRYGDWVEVLVINSLSVTSALHWHGMSLYGTPDMDGVPGLTQCGIPAGGSLLYRFCAAPSGTLWYAGAPHPRAVVASLNSLPLPPPSAYPMSVV